MELKEKILYWLESADYDLQTAKAMQNSRRYSYTAFMCQQALEKIIKAIYLQNNVKEAPKSHNLVYLIGITNITLTEDQTELLAKLSSFYLEGRYPTYKEKMSKLIDKAKAQEILIKSKEIFKCLKSQIK